MKRILLILMMVLSFGASAQTKASYPTLVYSDWQLSNDGGYGIPSFYWKVTRSTRPNTLGQYKYDVLFFSNSFYNNGEAASTYVWGIKMNVDGYNVCNNVWLIFKDTYSNNLVSFYSYSLNPNIIITWEGLSVY
jgi:hypothetical protein